MARNIVVLSDGTGNSAAKIWKTNVWRLYEALDLSDGSQIARYDDGVGTSSFKPIAILGGALGYGLKRNVIALYCFLCRHYKAGDQIYAFGFSRGAFTIRVLAAMVVSQGLVPWNQSESELRRNAKAAYRNYRYSYGYGFNLIVVWPLRKLRDGIVALKNLIRGHESYRQVSEENAHPKIHFLGLWDTVDAYGLPIYEMIRAVHLFFWPLGFPNRDLSDRVERACHALALDDERTTFHPLLWNEENEPQVSTIQKERLSQVWFAGMHCNVGGGYPDDGMANVPLKWIMDEAENWDLKFKPKPSAPDEVESDENLRGRIYDSRHGVAGYFRYGPRKVEYLCDDKIESVFVKRPKVHESVFERITTGTDGYAPIVLPAKYAVVNAAGTILGTNPYESQKVSDWRATAQEKVWNFVWLKRVSYFVTLAATLYLAAFPCIYTDKCKPARVVFQPAFEWLPPLERVANGILNAPETAFGWFSQSVGGESGPVLQYLGAKISIYVPQTLVLVGAFVPKFVDDFWLATYKAFPGRFIFDLVIVILLTLWGSTLQGWIYDKMRKIWQPVMEGSSKLPQVHLGWFARLRTSELYRWCVRQLRGSVVPFLFALLYVLIIWYGLRTLWSALR